MEKTLNLGRKSRLLFCFQYSCIWTKHLFRPYSCIYKRWEHWPCTASFMGLCCVVRGHSETRCFPQALPSEPLSRSGLDGNLGIRFDSSLPLTYCLRFVLRSCWLSLRSLYISTPTPCLSGHFFLLALPWLLPHWSAVRPWLQQTVTDRASAQAWVRTAPPPKMFLCLAFFLAAPCAVASPWGHTSGSAGLRDLQE